MKFKINKKSWRNVVAIFLVVILSSSIISLLIIVSTYSDNLKKNYIDSNVDNCERIMDDIDSRLNFVYEQIHDIFLAINNDKQFSKDLYRLDPFVTNKIIDMFHNKLLMAPDISAMFFYDNNSDVFLYCNSSSMALNQILTVKDYLRLTIADDQSYLTDKTWLIKTISNKNYCFKSIKVGRFVIGAVSDCDKYKIADKDSSLFLINNEEIYYCCGEKELFDVIDINKETRFEKGHMIASTKGKQSLLSCVLISEADSFVTLNTIVGILFIISSVIGVTFIILLYIFMKKKISAPTDELIKATNEISKGNLEYRLLEENAGSDEFEELYKKFNDMTSQIGDLKIKSYDMKLKEDRNRLIMLRAQLKPHTFLNGITTISNMTYDNNPEKMRDYIYSFSQFTRYMLHTDSEWISLKEELDHIRNYIEMQRIRFPSSIELSIECESEIENVKIPFLLLYSLVENSFKHAMSLIKTLNIKIKCEKYETDSFKGIRLIEEDDGDGFPSEVLDWQKQDYNLNTKEHLGLTNVRYTLNILYKKDDLLRLSNKEEGGARVEMLIPEGDKNETIDM